ncbi:F-box/kelch-repeat protein SKIP6 [Morus notabilis]|uniref:F-box/kelch-repeat protein SKIP6 n=1 Tax=Morus notabilis TaxID=981085 RepID=W9S811_9ROSA|nr:F-box/kelch-repeat protein SKIP6 [Morus notabilis]EXC19721.1 F-box/kelch-repeat protein SKIP6 [Morus notabilis]
MSSTTTTDEPPTPLPPPPLIPSLPDDVALNCLARIPRWHHPILSAVSKPLRSLLSSPLFFSTRILLKFTQPLLYLSLRLHHPSSSSSSWFALLRPPNPNDAVPTKPLLVPVPPIPVPSIGSCYAVLGPKIYVLGGSLNDVPSPHVWVLDCRFHTWELGPRMRIPREFAAAGVVAGKIYVMGGCAVDSWARAAHWAEVLEDGEWRAVPSPAEVRDKWMHASAVVGDRVFAMADRGGVVFDAKSGVWEGVESGLDLGWRGRACVVNGVLYCYDYLGKIRGFGFGGVVGNGEWRELKGVEKGLPKFLCGATMANVGGKLVVVWEEKGNGKEMEIWCAEIEVSEDKDGGLLGKISWSSKVLSVPVGSSIVHCAAVSL